MLYPIMLLPSAVLELDLFIRVFELITTLNVMQRHLVPFLAR